MPVEITRFSDDDEVEDEDLLGKSTLKHLGTTPNVKGKKRFDDEDDEEEIEEEIVEEAEEAAEDAEVVEEDVEEDVE